MRGILPVIGGGGAAIEQQMWTRARYDLSTRVAGMDKDVSGITFTQEGDAIRVTIASGTGPHTDPTAGAYRFWHMQSSISRRLVRFDQSASGGWQGAFFARIDVLEGLGAADGVELSVGTAQGSAAADQAQFGGIHDAASPTIVAMRRLSSALSRTVDANPSGNVLAAVMAPNYNIGTNQLITGSNLVIGDTSNEPRLLDPGATPFDLASGSGNLAIHRYLCINVRCVSATTAPRSYLVRPSALIIDWRAP